MIGSETVFIVGAGASVPYGFPVGSGLRGELCSSVTAPDTPTQSKQWQLLRDIGFGTTPLSNFRHEFLHSGCLSIDEFIAMRHEFDEIGRHAIAAALIQREKLDALNNVRGQPGNGDWYQWIWTRMRAGVSEPRELTKNKISFITFNYDRSLETYLLNGIRYYYRLNIDRAQEILSETRIHHIYGSLGSYRRNTGYFYEAATADNVAIAANTLLTMPSNRPDVDEKAQSLIKGALNVYTVGFGYDTMNCHRLGVADALRTDHVSGKPRRVAGTRMGMTTAEYQSAGMNFASSLQALGHFMDADSFTFLRAEGDTSMA